uniref:Epidermal growth factor receptor kinase substrate 8-like protein 3 n=1 Tax=Callorhinchus milii TaxID=7868 RepID=V9KIJ0_CALMI
MYGDYDTRHLLDYGQNQSQANELPPQKPQFQRTNSVGRPSAKSIYRQRKEYAQSLNSMQDLSQYRVEHLITCDLDFKDTRTLDSCISKLKMLDAKGRVWGQDMMMQMSDSFLKLSDIETRDELETFSIDAVYDSRAILNSCIYNSVLALTIRDSRKSLVYLFQCEEVSADLIDMAIKKITKGTKQDRGDQGTFRSNLDNMLTQPVPSHHMKSGMPPPQDRWSSSGYTTPAMSEYSSWAGPNSRAPSEHGSDKTNVSTSSFNLRRDMEILNHALDDIELFVNKIQQIVGSNKQKEEKKKKKKPKKGSSHLPPEAEFVDFLQKSKYVLNLLGKLDAYLNNPSATDLCRGLFQTLNYVLKHCPVVNLEQNVITPFLKTTAINFLQRSLNADEQQFWISLGPAWNTPRSDWQNGDSFPGYIPSFSDGWQPPLNQSGRSPTPSRFSTDERRMESPQYPPLEMSQNMPKQAVAMYDFTGRNSREINVSKGDVLEVLEATKQWWKVRSLRGEIGYVPCNIMEPVNHGAQYSPHHESRRFGDSHAAGVTIHSRSNEVRAWLQSKGYRPLTVKSFGVLSGSELLSLSKQELNQACPEEGDYVYRDLHRG